MEQGRLEEADRHLHLIKLDPKTNESHFAQVRQNQTMSEADIRRWGEELTELERHLFTLKR
jgi:hypothetical protein